MARQYLVVGYISICSVLRNTADKKDAPEADCRRKLMIFFLIMWSSK